MTTPVRRTGAIPPWGLALTAIGVVLGLIVLHQRLSVSQLAGILLVVLASAAAQRGGRRPPAIEVTGTDPELVDAVG